MISKLSTLAWGSLLLLVLTACGGGGAAPKAVPEPPSRVFVADGTVPTIITWEHGGTNALEYALYREPIGGSSGATEIARLPVGDENQEVYIHRDSELDDETTVRYSVAAVGPAGMSAATPQAEASAFGVVGCAKYTRTINDRDGDGIPNNQETTPWQIYIATTTASESGVAGQLQRDKPGLKSVKSNPDQADSDDDGLCDLQEHGQSGTDPENPDTDGDALGDHDEVHTWNSDAKNPDTDDDAFDPVLTSTGKQQVQYVTLASANQTLLDGREVCSDSTFSCPFKTSPTLADTDGDSYSDYYEIIEAGGDFNPLVADLPQLELSLVGTADLVVNIGYTNSAQQADTKSVGLEKGTSSSDTNYQSNVRKVWHKYDQSVSLSGGYDKDGFSASVKLKASFEEGSATTKTTGWSKTSSQNSQKTYNDAVQTAREQGRSVEGGSITMGVEVANTGDLTYNLSDLAVTALQRDPNDPASFKTIATLKLADPLGAGGVSLAPNQKTGTLEVKADLTAANVVLGLMADPSSLLFEIGTFTISNEQKVDFNFLEQVTDAQTGLVVVDFGNGNVISKRVATNVMRENGSITGIKLSDALNTLGVDFTTQTTEVAGSTVTVLTSVTDPATGSTVAVDGANNSFWATLKTADTTGPVTQNFEEIRLEAGKAAYLLYVTDQDEDGLYLRDETLHGTLDTNKDTDGDGRSDGDEVKTGWKVPAALPPLYPAVVYSDPAQADTDLDGLNDAAELKATTDPNSPDTDGDRLCDGTGKGATGICATGVTADPEPLEPRFIFLPDTSAPKPYTITTPTDAPVAANFSLPVKETSTFTVRSLVRGPVAGKVTFSNGGRTVLFTPENGWLPGEEIVVALSNITSTTGKKLPVYQYGFRTQTNKAGRFPGSIHDAFSIDTDVSKETHLERVLTGDFNQDGRLDLAVIYSPDYPTNSVPPPAATVYVLFQSSSGWDTQVTYSLKGASRSLVTGDFNNDGRLDLAAGLSDRSEVGVLLAGSTRGEFSNPVYASVGAEGGTWDLATADFNGDGNVDLVAASNELGVFERNTSNAVTVLLGNKNGTFTTGTSLSPETTPSAVATGDVNGDGFMDVVVGSADYSGNDSGVLNVYLGGGNGILQQPTQSYRGLFSPTSVATGDFNADGFLDIVAGVSHFGNDDVVSLLLNKGNGTFAQQPNTPVANVGPGLTLADFDGDSRLDIAVSNVDDSGATILYASENVGTFDKRSISRSIEGTTLPVVGYGLAATLVGSPDSAANAPLSLVVVGQWDDPPFLLNQLLVVTP